ncbi:MAG: DNA alkylation repair protein [Planctomycetota bacterium]
MSMNFGREQALLRQRLTANASEQHAAELAERFGPDLKYLGAAPDEVATAGSELVAQFPEMGRAQMTAFVRTLWKSKTHELRLVGVDVLARRSELLEAPDMPVVIELLEQSSVPACCDRIADDVLGPLVSRNKKLWKDVQKLGKHSKPHVQRAAVRACRAPLASDGALFERFEKLVTPMLGDDADAELLKSVDGVLAAAAEQAAESVRAFAAEHGRVLG